MRPAQAFGLRQLAEIAPNLGRVNVYATDDPDPGPGGGKFQGFEADGSEAELCDFDFLFAFHFYWGRTMALREGRFKFKLRL